MAVKEVFVKAIRPFWHGGKCYGPGSVVKMKENDANMCIGLKRGVAADEKAEKAVPFGKKAEAKPVEKK